MKARTIAIAGLVGGAVYAMRRRARAKAHAGIADVDPEPLAQVAGEGIDPDATEAAHTDIAEQQAKFDALRE